MKIVLATKNPGKLRELKELAGAADLELLLAPEEFDPEETGSTFTENAVIKAKAAAEQTKMYSLADDSGIEVTALGGKPGIRSARYCAGTDEDRRRKLLADVNATASSDRSAAFVCAMALAAPDGSILHTTVARWPGVIHDQESGSNGFGYDPIFYLPDKQQTSAQISPQEKNALSHRAQAWRMMLEFIERSF